MPTTTDFIHSENSPITKPEPSDFNQVGYISEPGLPNLSSTPGPEYEATNYLIGSTVIPETNDYLNIDDFSALVTVVERSSTALYTAVKEWDEDDSLVEQETLVDAQVWWPMNETVATPGSTFSDVIGGFDVTTQGTLIPDQPSLHSHSRSINLNRSGYFTRSTLPDWVYDEPRTMSISFWMQHTGLFPEGTQTIITDATNLDSGANSDNHQFLIDFFADWRLRLFWEYNTGVNESTTFRLADIPGFDITDIHHYVVSRDAKEKEVHLYIDGVFIETITYDQNPTGASSYEWIIGGYEDYKDGMTRFVDAHVQDISLYKSVLTLEHAQFLYNDGNGVDYTLLVQ